TTHLVLVHTATLYLYFLRFKPSWGDQIMNVLSGGVEGLTQPKLWVVPQTNMGGESTACFKSKL
ncbi:hypothetical protein, partial [Salmonella sp. s54395]|uniref:hypothetical protein n=1 Tax=Salmonella sp. s54395 TaxID=3159664 RepID=UPI00398041E6